MVDKDSNFTDFVRFHPYTYACTQQQIYVRGLQLIVPPISVTIVTSSS